MPLLLSSSRAACRYFLLSDCAASSSSLVSTPLSVQYRLPSILGPLHTIALANLVSEVLEPDDVYDRSAISGRVVNPYMLLDLRSEGSPGSLDLTAEGS